MAEKKGLLKGYYARDEKNKEFEDGCLKDLSVIENRSTSAIIEQMILDGLLPSNAIAKEIAYKIYDSKSGGIKTAIADLYQLNAAGTEPWKAKYSNLKPIAEFCLRNINAEARFSGDENQKYHFRSQIEAIAEHINKMSSDIKKSNNSEIFIAKAEYTKKLVENFVKSPNSVTFRELFEIFIDFWPAIGDLSITFRALYDLMIMVSADDFSDNEYTRTELRKILIVVSDNW